MHIQDTRFLFFHRLDEDPGHLFVKCKTFRAMNMMTVQEELSACSNMDDVLDCLWSLNEQELVRIVTFLWVGWQPRNRVGEGERPWELKAITHRC